MNISMVWFVIWWWTISRSIKSLMQNWSVRSLLSLLVMNFLQVSFRWRKYILLKNVRSVLVIRWQVVTVTKGLFPVLFVRKICRSLKMELRLILFWTHWVCLHVWTSDRFLKLFLVVLERRSALSLPLLFSMVLPWKIWISGQTRQGCHVIVRLIFAMVVRVRNLTRQQLWG